MGQCWRSELDRDISNTPAATVRSLAAAINKDQSWAVKEEENRFCSAQIDKPIVCLSVEAPAEHAVLLTGRLPERAAVVAAVNPAPDRHRGEVHEPLVLNKN